MTITLGTVTLNQHISWRGRFNDAKSSGQERSTIGGRTIVDRLLIGTPDFIVLEAIEEDDIRKGYFLKADLDALCVYRDNGTIISLSYHNDVYLVVIPIDGIRVEKTIWQSEFTADEKYIGSITLKRS